MIRQQRRPIKIDDDAINGRSANITTRAAGGNKEIAPPFFVGCYSGKLQPIGLSD
jgi:hypothetical protein